MASPAKCEAIEVKPLAGALGAEIGGVDLAQIRDNRTWSDIHRAFLDYQVIVFRGQELSLDDITHPETGRNPLYLNLDHTVRFADMTEAESEPLIEYLAAHAVEPEFTCRVRWEKGTFTVWDNRCTLHCALNDYHAQRRVMQRITVGGEVPA